MVMALPPTSTTTTGLPVAATRWISSSCRPGRASDARSRNSPSSMPATTIATSLRAARSTASSISASAPAACPTFQTSRTQALPVGSKYSTRRSYSRSRSKRYVGQDAPARDLAPVVDHQRVVDVEAIAVVAVDADPERPGRRGPSACRSSAPSRSRTASRRGSGEKSVHWNWSCGSTRVKTGGPASVDVVEVLAEQARAHGVAACAATGTRTGRSRTAGRAGRSPGRSAPVRARSGS